VVYECGASHKNAESAAICAAIRAAIDGSGGRLGVGTPGDLGEGEKWQ
jgi:hypothetical protein